MLGRGRRATTSSRGVRSFAGSVVFLLKTFGVLPHTFFTQNGWQIGSLLEMILLSMTLEHAA